MKLTREELARRAGVSTSTIARFELDDKLPNGMYLLQVAQAVDTTVEHLVNGAEQVTA